MQLQLKYPSSNSKYLDMDSGHLNGVSGVIGLDSRYLLDPAVVLMFLQLKAPYDQPGKKVLFSLILYFSGFIFSCCLIVAGAKVNLSSGQIGECENQSYFCCHGTGDA